MTRPQPPIIRKARPGDAAAALRFMDLLLREPGGCLPRRRDEFNVSVSREKKLFAEYARSRRSIFLVAVLQGQIVGLLNCDGGTVAATRHAASLGVSVSAAHRNRGIGGALLRAAVRWAKRTRFIRRIDLLVYADNRPAIHLYRKMGFRMEGTKVGAVLHNGRYADEHIMALRFVTAAPACRAPRRQAR